jgi:FtsZ-binding cell division protein ZapB
MELLRDQQDADSLETLEERIRQAIGLVARLRRERDAAVAEKRQVEADLESARRDAAAAREQAAQVSHESESLRSERTEVRARIEKLLSQIDSLGAE